jgi:hypothetical protein
MIEFLRLLLFWVVMVVFFSMIFFVVFEMMNRAVVE